MPKVDVRDLDFIDDDYVSYEKIRRTPKKEVKSDEKTQSDSKKSDVKDN